MGEERELSGKVSIDASGIDSDAKKAVDALESIEEAGSKLGVSLQAVADAQGRVRDSNGRFVAGAQKSTEAVDSWGKALQPLNRGIDGLVGKLGPAKAATLAWSAATTAAGVAVDIVTVALKAATVATVALTAAATASLVVYGKFETSFARVSTILDKGDVSAAFLSDQVRDLAMAMGVDATVAASALADAIGSGIDSTESIPFLAEALKAAKAGFADAGPVVKAFSGIIATYGMSTSDAAKISDVLFQTVKVGTTTINDLAANLGTVAPLASASGVKFEELSAAIAVLTNNMFSTETAATGVRAALATIIAPSAEAAEKLAGIGASARDLKEVGFEEVLRRIGEATNGDAEAIAKLGFETKAANALAVLAGSGFEALARTIDTMGESAGVSGDALAKVVATLEANWSRAKVIVEDSVISIGQILAPFASDLLAPIVVFGERSAKEFRGLREEIDAFGFTTKGVLESLGIDFQASGGIVTLTLNAISAGLAAVGQFIEDWAGPINFAIDSVTNAVTTAYGAFKLLGYYIDIMLAPIKGMIIGLESLGVSFESSTSNAEALGHAFRLSAAEVAAFAINVQKTTVAMEVHNATIAATNKALAQNKQALIEATKAQADKTKAFQVDADAVTSLLKEEEEARKKAQRAFEDSVAALAKGAQQRAKWDADLRKEQEEMNRKTAAAVKVHEAEATAIQKKATAHREAAGAFDDYFKNFDKLIAKETGQATQVTTRRSRSQGTNDAGASLFGIGGPSFGIGSRNSGGSSIFGLQSFEVGGRIPATMPINAHEREFVLPEPAATAFGPAVLEAMRQFKGTTNVTIHGPQITIEGAGRVQSLSEQARALIPEITRAQRLGIQQSGVVF